MPLKAYTENKLDKLSFSLTPEDRSNSYFCPVCDDKFLIVLPDKTQRVKHFRHTNCRSHGEPETIEHLQLKQCVFDAAKGLGLDAELEFVVDKEKERIIDVLVRKGDLKVAVECQCSQTSIDYVVSKSNFYITSGYIPLWIFGVKWFDNAYFRRSHSDGYDIQRISKIEKLFFRNKRDFFYSDGDENFFKFKDFKFRWSKGTSTLYSMYLGWYSITQTPIEYILLNAFSLSSHYKYVIPELLYASFCGQCKTYSNVYCSNDDEYLCLNCGFTYVNYRKYKGFFLPKKTIACIIESWIG